VTTLEIASYGASVAMEGNLLRVGKASGEPTLFPIEDIEMLVLQVPAVSATGGALAALAERGIPVMLCDRSRRPVGWLAPTGGAEVFDPDRARNQAALGERTRARLWRSLVRAKIEAQADLLETVGGPAARLRRLAGDMDTGDPGNIEATAAQLYWPALFGDDFRRRSDSPIVHALDWGYAVLRGIVCRAIVAAGLHPAIGVHHRAGSNGFNLADDLIEPFRPAVDRRIAFLKRGESEKFSFDDAKPALAEIGEWPVRAGGQTARCRAAIRLLAESFVRIVDAGQGRLVLPERIMDASDAERLETDVADGLL
jgi:CRISPR-associated protein Cas1